MASTQEITRRLKSVKSTKKITRAMQMVSAAKMRKAQTATLASRSYAELAGELIRTVSTQAHSKNKLLQHFLKASKVGVIVISTNRGLVGGFNNNLLLKLKEYTSAKPEVISELVVMGRKAAEFATRNRYDVQAQFSKFDTTIPIEEIYPLAKLVTNLYRSGEYREIVIVYSHFVSTLSQTATVKTVLPFTIPNGREHTESNELYEPDAETVQNYLIPRIIESQIYQAILESDASEHSARMVMMKNATEAAGDLIDDLTLTFNKLRQNKITTELSEITAGKIALEGR